MACLARSAASASSVVAGYGIAVLVFLAPKFYFFFLRAFDTSLAHLLVVLYLRLRELSVLPEDDVEAESEHAKRYQYQCCYEYFHFNNQ